MALEGTHIRIALDLKDKYQVRDLNKYIVGTVYPDSRYVTGIARSLSHPTDYINWNMKEIDDFKKGWHLHLLSDEIQLALIRKAIPEVFDKEIKQNSDEWVKLTAIKLLQDIDDVQKIDIVQYLPFLKYAVNPNGENIGEIKRYNQIFPRMYTDPMHVNIDSYSEMLNEFRVGDEIAQKVKNQAWEYIETDQVAELVKNLYAKMLDGLNK